jgi:ribonucleoside-diphosphate reductase beta chain
MTYSTFQQEKNDQLLEPMFFGNHVNVSRYDQQKHPVFEKLIEKSLSFFWRPEEINLTRDSIDWKSLPECEKHIFISNLKYQTLLDSIAARSVSTMFLPVVSLPELETLFETHAFYETIHSRSYTHIIRNMFDDPSVVFDDIIVNPAILKRASSITVYFDDFIQKNMQLEVLGEGSHNVKGEMITVSLRKTKEALFRAMCALNALESIRFYVSFACSFAFAERKLLEANAKVIRLIARDENLHKNETSTILNLWSSGQDDPEMKQISIDLKEEGRQIFLDAVEQEKEWAKELFKFGSMIGLNEAIICQFIEYTAHHSMKAIGLDSPYLVESNPLPWMRNYLETDALQVAPQEAEISSYLVGQIDSSIDSDSFDNMEL